MDGLVSSIKCTNAVGQSVINIKTVCKTGKNLPEQDIWNMHVKQAE